MKYFLLAFCIWLSILQVQAQTKYSRGKVFKFPSGITAKDYLPGVIIVKFRTAGNQASIKSIGPRLTLKTAAIRSLKKKFPEYNPEASTFERARKDKTGLSRIYELQVSSTANLQVVINEILRNPLVEYAEPSYIHRNNFVPFFPNDPFYPQQPHLQRVFAPEAWGLVRNIPSAIIGIVDSGSELNHEDLAANIYYNIAETGNGRETNGKDDDGNGKVDDWRGWDFVGGDENAISEDNNPNVTSSQNDHGVHVSGIASAVTNNTKGISAIAFNSAKLLIVKAGADNSGDDIYRGYEGIKYAVDMGADIINCSWGSPGGGSFGQDVINYALEQGAIVVAAAGNSGTETAEFPAAYTGVYAVANTDNTDLKHPSSSFGSHVSLSAPGSSILSTGFGNSYNFKTGTSMSAPLVSGAAALVKSFYPEFTMRQVGELIRVTADNLGSRNPTLVGKLGKGRLNVFRALTETPPSVRISRINPEERVAPNLSNPDTLYLFLDITNYLWPVNNLTLRLSSSNPNVTVLEGERSVSSLGTLATLNNVGPFKVAIRRETPSNTEVSFRLEYSAGSYQDFENFSVTVAKDYLDLITPSIVTTLTSNGRIGFASSDQEGGSGFLYKGEQLLYEAALMIGNGPTRVSNNARSANGAVDEHFIKKARARELTDNADSTLAEAEFDDSGNANRLRVNVKHQMVVYKAAPNDKFTIAEYEIQNANSTALNNVYVGLFSDWDIGVSSNNSTEYDAINRLAYVYSKEGSNSYGGIKLLSLNAPPAYFPLSFDVPGNPLSDENLTIGDKWTSLSSGVQPGGLGKTSGVDVCVVAGNGPYTIPANSSIRVAFALVGGDNLSDLQTSAAAAQQRYNRMRGQSQEPTAQLELEVYPNPVFTASNSVSFIRFGLPEAGEVSLDLYNLAGQKIKTLMENQRYEAGAYSFSYNLLDGSLVDIESGVYFYRLRHNNQTKSKKVSIVR